MLGAARERRASDNERVMTSLWRRRPRRRLVVVALAAGVVLVALAGALAIHSWLMLSRFARAEARRSTLVYASPQALAPGINVRGVDLAGTLARLKYVESRGVPATPGQWRRTAGAWEIHVRGADGVPPQRIRLELRDERITRLTRDGRSVGAVALEPEILTSAGDRPGEEYRPVRLADVPLVLINAVLAAEDHRFFEHRGLDARGLVRAAWINFRAGRVRQGGSTITQQLVKNRLVGPRRTLGRKLNEAWLATLVEWRYPKEQILQAYLNEIYLGQRGALAIRGVGAAARAWFRKEPHQLTLGEAALLAGMIRAPNSTSPAAHPERARARRDVVLGRMRELGMLGDADVRAARAEPVRPSPAVAAGQPAPYFTDHVRAELEQRYGDVSESAGLQVFTTLDLALQRMAEAAVVRGLDRLETQVPALRRKEGGRRLQAALLALDPVTGEIRALVGGRDYQASQYNRATLARRQPGSAFKPFVFLAALRARGEDPPALTAASLVDDVPITVTQDGRTWSPRNYEDRYEGRVTARRALEQSLNAATVRVAEAAGLPAVVATARQLGLEIEMEPVPALALGVFETTPLELARAYLPLANGGVRTRPPATVRGVREPDGPLEPAERAATRVLSPAEAYLMTSLLEGVVRAGTATAARGLGVTGSVAGKTGTTNDARDAWFVGYTPGLLTVVWVGFDNGEPHGLSGSRAALPIWADFMRRSTAAYPQGDFTVPAGVAFADIDPTTGLLATSACPLVVRETFLAGTEPERCSEHGAVGDQVIEWWRRLRDWFRR